MSYKNSCLHCKQNFNDTLFDFRFSLKRITSNLECEYISTDAMANFETVFCSNACLQRFGKNQFAL